MNKFATILRESGPARFLIPVGIILVVVGAIMFVLTQRTQDYLPANATVSKVELEEAAYTDSEGDHHPASYLIGFKYTVDGKEVESELSGLGEYKLGDKVKLFYNPEDPTQITMSKSLLVPGAMIAVGALTLLAGIVSAVRAVKKLKNMKAQEREWANG